MTLIKVCVAGVAVVAVLVGVKVAVDSSPSAAPAKEAKVPPASVTKPLKEEELNKVTLTEAAEKSLGIKTVAVQKRASSQLRVYAGEVTIPTGQTVIVAAPVGGVLREPAGPVPRAGFAIKRGQQIFQLLPLLTPEGRTTLATAQVDAEGQIENARTQLDAAKIALDRAKKLVREQAGSQRAVDEADAIYQVARKTLEATEARFKLLSKAMSSTEDGTAAPLPIDSPQDGLLRNITALPNQNVPSGAPLFEVADLDKIWVRVAVSVGDMDQIDAQAPAEIGNLAMKPGQPTHSARPATAPPSANPLAATVDLFYEAENSDGHFLPGERVGAALPLKGAEDAPVIPWSAVVHDIYGATWIYERVADRTYVRRRVAVRYVVKDQAVLAEGPPLGALVVAVGAQELFGAETGFSK